MARRNLCVYGADAYHWLHAYGIGDRNGLCLQGSEPQWQAFRTHQMIHEPIGH